MAAFLSALLTAAKMAGTGVMDAGKAVGGAAKATGGFMDNHPLINRLVGDAMGGPSPFGGGGGAPRSQVSAAPAMAAQPPAAIPPPIPSPAPNLPGMGGVAGMNSMPGMNQPNPWRRQMNQQMEY